MTIDAVRLKTEVDDPRVRAIVEELSAVCTRNEDNTGELLTALVLTAVSAVKSFGVHPLEFVKQFEFIYAHTRPADVAPYAPGSES